MATKKSKKAKKVAAPVAPDAPATPAKDDAFKPAMTHAERNAKRKRL